MLFHRLLKRGTFTCVRFPLCFVAPGLTPATGFGHGDHGATQDEPTTALGQLRECLYGASYELGLQRVGGEVTFWEPGAVRGARWAGRVQGRFVFVGGFIRTYLFRAFVFRNGQVDFVRQVASAFGTWSGYASANRNHRRDQRKECSTAWGEKECQSWAKFIRQKTGLKIREEWKSWGPEKDRGRGRECVARGNW